MVGCSLHLGSHKQEYGYLRCYDYYLVFKIINSLAKYDKNELLLKYKAKISYNKNSILVTKLFDKNVTDLNFNLINNTDTLSSKYNYLSNIEFNIVSKM